MDKITGYGVMVKKIIIAIVAITAFLQIAGEGIAEDSEINKKNSVAAYYFHGNFRCANCRNLEQYSKEAIEKHFKDELVSGKVAFKVINVEEKGNEHFVNDYQLYTRSLVISLVKNGKEVKSKNLAKTWEYLNNKPGFYQYVKEEVDTYLNELR